MKGRKAKVVQLVCPACDATFERPEYKIEWQKKMGREHMCCSQSCARSMPRRSQPRPHGTVARYVGKCRCDQCRTAAREAQRKRLAGMREAREGINELYGKPTRT